MAKELFRFMTARPVSKRAQTTGITLFPNEAKSYCIVKLKGIETKYKTPDGRFDALQEELDLNGYRFGNPDGYPNAIMKQCPQLHALMEDVKAEEYGISPNELIKRVEIHFKTEPYKLFSTRSSWYRKLDYIKDGLLYSILDPKIIGQTELLNDACKLIHVLSIITGEHNLTTVQEIQGIMNSSIIVPEIVNRFMNLSPAQTSENDESVSSRSFVLDRGDELSAQFRVLKKAEEELRIKSENDTVMRNFSIKGTEDRSVTDITYSDQRIDTMSQDTKDLIKSWNMELTGSSILSIQKRLETERGINSSLFPNPERLQKVLIGGKWVDINSLRTLSENTQRLYEQMTYNKYVKPLGIGELYKVVEDDVRYSVGEIAHIENVLQGEHKSRIHERKEETEEFSDFYSESTHENENESESTDRFELHSEAQRVLREESYFDQGITVNVQYGKFLDITTDTQFGFDKSKESSRSTSSTFAQETTEKARQKVVQNIRNRKTTRLLSSITERNSHDINNGPSDMGYSPTGNVVGIYRWLNKNYTIKLYPKGFRMMYEFIIPEPAAWYLHAQAHQDSGKDMTNFPSPPMVRDHGKSEEHFRPLTPQDLDGSNYLRFASEYGISDLEAPPELFKTISKAFANANYDQDNEMSLKHLKSQLSKRRIHTIKEELQVPDGYRPQMVNGIVTSSNLIEVLFNDKVEDSIEKEANESAWDSFFSKDETPSQILKRIKEGYNYDVYSGLQVKISLGSKSLTLNPTVNLADYEAGGHLHGQVPPLKWLLNENVSIGSGVAKMDEQTAGDKLPLSIMIEGVLMAYTINMVILCRRDNSIMERWQLDAYSKIMASYQARANRHEERLRGVEISQGVRIEGRNPAYNKELMENELKKHAISILTLSDIHQPPGTIAGHAQFNNAPEIDFHTANENGEYIQFFEQAFEWSNILYKYYPYYWSEKSKWPLKMNLDSPDPKFGEFLRAGAVRVIVPVRLNYEEAVGQYLKTGKIWHGSKGLTFTDDLHVDIIQEMREETEKLGEDPSFVDSWEVEVPTNLVILDDETAVDRISKII